MGEQDPVICNGESRDQFCFLLIVQARPIMIIGCGVSVSTPQVLSFPLPASLKKGGMVMAVSPWYLVAWKTLFNVRNNFREKDLCVYSCLILVVV